MYFFFQIIQRISNLYIIVELRNKYEINKYAKRQTFTLFHLVVFSLCRQFFGMPLYFTIYRLFQATKTSHLQFGYIFRFREN